MRDLSNQETRLLLAKVVEVGVRTVVKKTHIYNWKGELYLQLLGVPTGLSLSGVIGRITMDFWKDNISSLMANNKMSVYLLEKYVDDSELVTDNLAMGTRWDGEKMTVNEDTEKDDILANRTKEEVTMKAWGEMASSIIPGLTFTVDYPSNNPNNKVPMLDFQLWSQEEKDPEDPGKTRQTLIYDFFFTMANPKVLDMKSAMPHRTKISSMTQECVRRLNNTSRELDDKVKCEILSNFMRKLQVSGYGQKVKDKHFGMCN